MIFKGANQSNRGSTLLLVLSSLLTVSVLAGAFVNVGLYEHRFSTRNQAGTEAFYLSESAIDRALQWLRTQGTPPAGTQPLVLFGGWQALGEGSYLVTLDPADNNTGSFLKRYSIEGWGVSGPQATPSAVRRTTLVVQTESFARYAYFTDDERSPTGSTVWFVTADHIEGPTHTNGQFSMYGSPTFDGPVSSVAGSIRFFNPPPPGGNNPIFNGGLELGVKAKPIPTTFPTSLADAASQGGSVFIGNTTVTLLPSGTMKVTNAAQNMNDQEIPLPPNGVLYVHNGTVTLEGTLKGQLTIGTNQNVKVVNSVTYSDNPEINPSSTDLLGIVAGGNVVIASSAPANVTVDASIMALNTSFTVENYWTGLKGTLTVYGGIIQDKRGPVGTFSSRTGKKVSGYTKNYHYDERLLNMIPPFFPVTGDYVSLVWQGER